MTVGSHSALGTLVPPWGGGGPRGPQGERGVIGPVVNTAVFGAVFASLDTGRAFYANANAALTGGSLSGPLVLGARLPVPVAFTYNSLAWQSETATSTTRLDIYKNGLLNQTVALTGETGVVAITSIALAGGDNIELVYRSGHAPGAIDVTLG